MCNYVHLLTSWNYCNSWSNNTLLQSNIIFLFCIDFMLISKRCLQSKPVLVSLTYSVSWAPVNRINKNRFLTIRYKGKQRERGLTGNCSSPGHTLSSLMVAGAPAPLLIHRRCWRLPSFTLRSKMKVKWVYKTETRRTSKNITKPISPGVIESFIVLEALNPECHWGKVFSCSLFTYNPVTCY